MITGHTSKCRKTVMVRTIELWIINIE